MRKMMFALLGIAACFTPAKAQQPYFQQTVNYDIQVKLDDIGHHLRGFERFEYHNASPDTLTEIYIHLWPNAYKNNQSAFAKQKRAAGDLKIWFAKEEDRGYIDSLAFTVDNVASAWAEWEGNPDIGVLALPKPLLPGGKITVATPFHVKIPKSFSRLGHIDQQYQITQWYPKPAVYDRDGWHPMPYLDQGEFYSEFGSFDVKIDVPVEYVLGATGDLQQNPQEENFLKVREAYTRAHLASPNDSIGFGKVEGAGSRKVLHFRQSKVHDFAWFCDKHYFVLTDSVELPHSKRKVKTVAMFTAKDLKFWKDSPKYLNQSVYYYSLWNGDYPYNHATAVDGALSAGAGMEYPNITVVGAGGSASALEMVIMHEVGHNWFYGILGSNERLHPWMDEGLNTYMEGRYWNELHDGKMEYLPDAIEKFIGLEITHQSMAKAALEMQQGQRQDQPVEFHAAEYTPTNYGVITYMKTGLSFEYLEEFLGEELIIKCFQDYYEEWKFRHPQPDDIRASFEQTTQMDLGWFFEEYLKGTQRVDFRIRSYRDGVMTVQNRTGITLPVTLSLVDKEGKELKRLTSEPFLDEYAFEVPEMEFYKAVLNRAGHAPEFKVANNEIRSHGLFRKASTPVVSFLYKYPSGDKFHLNWLPAIGYNSTDGFMAGIMLHHGLFPKKHLEFYAMPMFGFKTETLTGAASVKYHWLPAKAFQRVTLGVSAASFSEYQHIRPELRFDFMPKSLRSDWRHSVAVSGTVAAFKERVITDGTFPFNGYYPDRLTYTELRWRSAYNETLQKIKWEIGAGHDLDRQATRMDITLQYSRRYAKKLGVNIRGFAGVVSHGYRLPRSMGYGIQGSRDFQGQHILVDRYFGTGLLSRQLVGDQGGFSTMVSEFDAKGILAFNMDHSIPQTPFRVFGDIGTTFTRNNFYWDAGLRIGFFKQSFKINLPFAGTIFGGRLPQDGKVWARNINFVLDITQLGSQIAIGGQ